MATSEYVWAISNGHECRSKMPKTADQLEKPRKLPVLLWWCQTLRTSKGSIKVLKPMVSKHLWRLVNTIYPWILRTMSLELSLFGAGTSHARSLLRCSSGGIQHAVTWHCLLVPLGCWMSKLREQKAFPSNLKRNTSHKASYSPGTKSYQWVHMGSFLSRSQRWNHHLSVTSNIKIYWICQDRLFELPRLTKLSKQHLQRNAAAVPSISPETEKHNHTKIKISKIQRPERSNKPKNT